MPGIAGALRCRNIPGVGGKRKTKRAFTEVNARFAFVWVLIFFTAPLYGIFEGVNILFADFNNDGTVNALDASAILKAIIE